MGRRIFTWLLCGAAAAALLVPGTRVQADDEADEVAIEIKAPLEAVDCITVPPTIMVLGVSIDVGAAHFESGDEDDSDSDSEEVPEDSTGLSGQEWGEDLEDSDSADESDSDSDDAVLDGQLPATCEDLLVGATVEVKFASDTAPLMAAEVGLESDDPEDDDQIRIKAPIQAVDTTLGTITLLGLPIDISTAHVEGCDDEDSETNNQTIDPDTLMIGQFVEVELDPNALPALVATKVEVKNFTNMVEVLIEDPLGNTVDDVDEDGQPIPTVAIAVTQSVQAAPLASAGKVSKKGSKGSKRTLQFQAQSNGSVMLHGLPTGKVNLSVAREVDGSMSRGRASLTVAPNDVTPAVVRLKGSKSKKSKSTSK